MPDDAAALLRKLSEFTGEGYDKGKPWVHQALWFACLNLVFVKWWCPARLRVGLLRAFGAKVGQGVLIRHRVRVLWPWKLEIGDACWVGEGAWLLNLERITLEANVCLSQESFICTGSHDRASPSFAFDNGPIKLCEGAWVGARAIILRGVTVGPGAVVAAGRVAAKDVEGGKVVW